MSIQFSYHPAMISGQAANSGYWICFSSGQLLVTPDMLTRPEQSPPWVAVEPSAAVTHSLALGNINGVACQAAYLQSIPEGWQEVGLRDYLAIAPEDVFKVVNAASQLMYWLSTQNFCSRCGSKLAFESRDRCLLCSHCHYRSYPKISPCVIVCVMRNEQILLAQSHRFRNNMFSCLAGFVECGESAEEAIVREVEEEVRIEVGNIRYVASQAWPFPHQLMLGYLADYAGGTIAIEEEELLAADWFDVTALPVIPPVQTIARQCIDQALAHIQANGG